MYFWQLKPKAKCVRNWSVMQNLFYQTCLHKQQGLIPSEINDIIQILRPDHPGATQNVVDN